MNKKYLATFEFDTQEELDDFLGWMSNSGEQDYWQQEEIDRGDDLRTSFDYFELNQGHFGPKVKCELE